MSCHGGDNGGNHPVQEHQAISKTRNCKTTALPIRPVVSKLQIQPAASRALSAELPKSHRLQADTIGLGSLCDGLVFGSSGLRISSKHGTKLISVYPTKLYMVARKQTSHTNQWDHVSGLGRGSEKLSFALRRPGCAVHVSEAVRQTQRPKNCVGGRIRQWDRRWS